MKGRARRRVQAVYMLHALWENSNNFYAEFHYDASRGERRHSADSEAFRLLSIELSRPRILPAGSHRTDRPVQNHEFTQRSVTAKPWQLDAVNQSMSS